MNLNLSAVANYTGLNEKKYICNILNSHCKIINSDFTLFWEVNRWIHKSCLMYCEIS